jgi:hypothetical protein
MTKRILLALTMMSSAMAVEISEQTLIDWAKSESFNAQKIELIELSKKADMLSFEDKFNPTLQAGLGYLKTNEISLVEFMPINTPMTNAEIKIVKPTQYGVAASVSTYVNQTSNRYFTDGTTAGVGAALSIDLYKDIAGRLTRAQKDNLTTKHEIAQKERNITQHTFVQEVRKLYWMLVANSESLKVAKSLLKTSERLETDTYKRFKNNIADRGDLARVRSQVQARKGQIHSLEFQKSQLVQKLKELFPQKIGEQAIELKRYNLEKTVANVMACSAQISKNSTAPKEYTTYDEILELLKNELKLSQKLNNSYSQADLKLMGEFKYIGKDYSYGDSFSNISDEKRNSYQVGLQLNIPLGKTKKTTEQVQNEMIQKQNISRYREIEGKMSAFHSQTINAIGILYKVMAAQQKNEKLLKETLEVSNKKFDQARLSARDLIMDEDNYLQNNLNEINTKYSVIETIINYFTVFSDTPCEINYK